MLTCLRQQLRAAGQAVQAKSGGPPNLIVVILPEGGNDIYTAVKQYVFLYSSAVHNFHNRSFSFGDITVRNVYTSNDSGYQLPRYIGWCRYAMHEELEMLSGKAPILCQCLLEVRAYYSIRLMFARILTNTWCRINVKLGGINTVPDPSSVSVLTDPHNPTIVMGKLQ